MSHNFTVASNFAVSAAAAVAMLYYGSRVVGVLVFRVPLEYLFFFPFGRGAYFFFFFLLFTFLPHTAWSSSCVIFFFHRIFCAVQDCLSPGKGRALKKIDVVLLWRNYMYYFWFWN